MYETERSAALSPAQKTALFAPGTRVRITQQIPRRTDTYTTTLTGTVLRHERQNSASWFARNKCGRIWLDRLVIQKPDGEISTLNLDEYTVVDILNGPAAVESEAPLVEPAQDPAAGIT